MYTIIPQHTHTHTHTVSETHSHSHLPAFTLLNIS